MNRLHTVLRGLGLPGWMGMLMAGVCGWVWLAWLPQQRAELAQAHDQVAELRRGLTTITANASTGQGMGPAQGADAAVVWQQVWERLPSRDEGLAVQAALLARAQALGIELPAVQFRGAPLRTLSGVWRQQMALPIETSYPALRQWIDEFQRQPAVSIDALDISRSDVMSDRVKGRLSVSLWWRQEAH